MKITKNASGKTEVRISKSEWEKIGKKMRWITPLANTEDDVPYENPYTEEELEQPEQSVAEIIFQQLGGHKFAVMTGAKNLASTGNGLSFRLTGSGGFTKDGINYVKITLNDMDTYDMEFGKIKGSNYKVITTKNDVYNDMLQNIFTDVTGLDTKLF